MLRILRLNQLRTALDKDRSGFVRVRVNSSSKQKPGVQSPPAKPCAMMI